MITEEQIAKVCHEVNRAYCQALGDNSQPPWKNASALKKSNTLQAVRNYILSISAETEKSRASAEAQEIVESWVNGPEKYPDLGVTTRLGVLPPELQAREDMFVAVVRAVLTRKEAA
jgi:hypothetical protein